MNFSPQQAILYKKNGKYPGIFTESGGDILKIITGLESSAGAVIISSEKSALFVDGRYAFAATKYVDSQKFDILDLRNEEITKWIEKNLPAGSSIACDYEYYTHSEMFFLTSKLKNYQIVQIDLKKALNIPSPKFAPHIYHLNRSVNRWACLLDAINQNNLDGYLICDPCSIAWLLNIRDLNQKYTPVVLGYLLVTKNNENFFYLDNQYNSYGEFRSENDLQKDMSRFFRIGIDESQTPVCIKHGGFVDVKNPCLPLKSIKNSIEIDDIKLAAQKDSSAIINFLYWFHNNTKKITELDAVEKLLYFREQQEGFVGESFKTIAAADENAAIIHYHPCAETNRFVTNILLLDSGGQYKHGTTDITRTISIMEPTEEQKFYYTLVLKGHIALASALFPFGTVGSQLEILVRQFLWMHAKDFNHSTGHGIGYMSHVHEGPIAIARGNNIPLQSGMILSNEPGYYQENSFGIRLENMILVTESAFSGYLSFETISLVPFDHKFIHLELLSPEDISWLRRYNQCIVSTLKLSANVLHWLQEYYFSNFI
ncbi:MAG: aminopeptidase P family protein [Holosporaceae bacterium]|jgi:Xaa-Pro aminopeptidase|nr:aminopeptidase P family protein [Holosporaceae bacterium]